MNNDSILAELKPCGYVLATSQYKFFALECIYCDEKYGHWATFLQHLRNFHNEIVDETQRLIESTEEILAPEQQDSGLTNQDCFSNTINEDAETTDNDKIYKVEELDEMENVIENVLSEKKLEEDVYVENTQNSFENEETTETTISNENHYDSLGDLNQFNEYKRVNLSEFEAERINIDLKIYNALTVQFIQTYKKFPTLWAIERIRNNVDEKQYLAQKEMIRSLSEHDIHISTVALKELTSKLHKQCCDIAIRLEEGIEISDIEEKYLALCSFLKPHNTPPEQIYESYETECEDTLSDRSLYDKSSTRTDDIESLESGFDFTDGDTDILQDRKQTLLKFSTRNNITCDFIQCFRDQLCLWNPQNAAYDMKERVKGIDNIKEFFSKNYSLQLTERKIKNAIKRLYVFYKKCISSRCNLNEIRKYYFDHCEFLADADFDNMKLIDSNANQKISFSILDEFTLGFIDFCGMHPVLWDKNHPNYSVLNIRKQAYEEIATNLHQIYNIHFNNEELYYAISRLKYHYYNLQRKKVLEGTFTKEDEEFLERCSFLPTSNINLQCHICERLFRSYSTLQTHLLKAHNIGELPHKCDYCEQRFAQRNVKKEHEIRTHTKEFEWFCPYCAKGFANRRDMELHQMVHTGERKLMCEHCGKGFRLKHQMTEHVKVMHERLRRFKCTMCPKDFLRKRELDDHIRTHLNIRDKICNVCGKGFTNVHGLFRHKQLHSDVKRYECTICGERFRRIPGLSSHKKRKHQNANQQKKPSNMFVQEKKEETEICV